MVELIDYRVAEAVEVITRRSTEEAKPQPAIRWYSRFLGVSERSLYKIVQRAFSYGFRLGLSLNLERIGVYMLFVLGDEVALAAPPVDSYRAIDGRIASTYYVPYTCLDQVARGLERRGVEYYVARALWGSRPALVTASFMEVRPETMRPETVERLVGLVRALMEAGPLMVFWGRRYVADKQSIAIVDEARRDALKSIASIARELSLDPARAQRKFYGLWERRVVLGYSVVDAPYLKGVRAIALVSHSDPMRLSYAIPVAPGVVAAYPLKMPDHGLVLLEVAGHPLLVSDTLSLVKSLGAAVEKVIVVHRDERISPRKRYSEAILETPGELLECPTLV